MPNVHGILETAIHSADPKQAAAFYRRLFGFEVLLESERLIALDAAGRDVLLIFQAGVTDEPFDTPGGTIPGHGVSGRNHLAFAISAEDVPAWRLLLDSAGVALESSLTWPGGAKSLYCRDPDGHLVVS